MTFHVKSSVKMEIPVEAVAQSCDPYLAGLFYAHLQRLCRQGRSVTWMDAPVVIGRLADKAVPVAMKAMEALLDAGEIAVGDDDRLVCVSAE
jgi:hypothetical protein